MIIIRKLAVLFIILLGIFIFLISPIGLNTTLYLVSHVIPGKLTYRSASGNLTKSLTLTNLEYKNKFIDIKSDYLRITWHPRKLMRRELAIDTIHAHNLSVEVYRTENTSTSSTGSSTSNTSAQFSPLDFSWTVTINHSMISNLKLKYDAIQKTFNIPLITLQGILSRDNINLKLYVNQNIEDQPSGTATLEGTIKNYTLKADYKNILKKQYYTLIATGDQTHLTTQINTESYQANTVNINGEAYLSWNKQLIWRANVRAEGLPLAIPSLYPLSRGKFDLSIEGSFDGSSLNQSANFSNVTLWLINGSSFNGQMQFNQKNNVLTLKTTLQNDNDYLILDASVNHDLNLSWKVHVDELSDLLIDLNGSLTSSGTIQKQSNRSNIQASFTLSNSSIGNLNVDEVNINVNGTLDKHTITIDAAIQQSKVSGQLVGKLEINPWKWSGTLNKLDVYSPNIGTWKLSKSTPLSFSNEQVRIDSLHITSPDKKGRLLVDVSWSQLKKTLEGKLDFSMDELSLPFLNITLKQLKANASANGKSATVSMRALSNGAPINLNGSASWNKALQLKANLSGRNILLIDTSEYTATVSPELTLLIQNSRVDLTGGITIPHATITPDDFISVVSLPADVKFVGAVERKPSLFKLYTNFNIILGDDVSINTQGIAGKLRGKLAIIKSPDQPFVGNGKLSIVDASYNIFGQKLTITKGHLNFVNSTLSNPNLDIQASRTLPTSLSSSSFGVERLTVGANISGTLKQPQISLFSRPVQLSDIDILSYLLFGSSAGGASGGGGPASNALILLQIANSLKSGKNTGDTSLLQKLQSGLGVTELGLQTQTDIDAVGNIVSSNEQLVAGAYLSPKVYFRYRYDLFYEENIFEAQYLLSKHWIAQTNASSLGNGADILYTIERGN